MSRTLVCGDEPVKRGDMVFIDPNGVIVKEELRGRSKPPTAEAIMAMAESMLEHGQQQPVQCRKLEDGTHRLQLNLGFTRTAAARLIRQGFTNSQGEFKQNAEFKLKAMVVTTTDKEALINNIVENAIRNDTSPIDDAQNQRRLREQHGYSDADIARLYQYRGQNKVGRLTKLLSLPEDIQDKVHFGQLTVTAAIQLLELPEEEMRKALAAALKENGEVDGSVVRDEIRNIALGADILNDDNKPFDDTDSAPARSVANATTALSLREIKKFYQEIIDDEEAAEPMKEFSKVHLAWLNGKKTAKQNMNAYAKLMG